MLWIIDDRKSICEAVMETFRLKCWNSYSSEDKIDNKILELKLSEPRVIKKLVQQRSLGLPDLGVFHVEHEPKNDVNDEESKEHLGLLERCFPKEIQKFELMISENCYIDSWLKVLEQKSKNIKNKLKIELPSISLDRFMNIVTWFSHLTSISIQTEDFDINEDQNIIIKDDPDFKLRKITFENIEKIDGESIFKIIDELAKFESLRLTFEKLSFKNIKIIAKKYDFEHKINEFIKEKGFEQFGKVNTTEFVSYSE